MITAKVRLSGKFSGGDGQTRLDFHADYADGRNKEWSKYTPHLNLTMTVLDEVAEKLDAQGAYTLQFVPEDEGEPAGA